MKNSKKGISLVILVVVIIVMGILVGMVAISTQGMMKETDAREFASELKQLEYLVKQNKKLNDNVVLAFTPRALTVSTLTAEQKEQMAKEIASGVTSITLYELDFNELDINDTMYGKKEDGNADDVYVVSNTTGKVYYLKGFKWEDKTYYTLTDELNELLGI